MYKGILEIWRVGTIVYLDFGSITALGTCVKTHGEDSLQ